MAKIPFGCPHFSTVSIVQKISFYIFSQYFFRTSISFEMKISENISSHAILSEEPHHPSAFGVRRAERCGCVHCQKSMLASNIAPLLQNITRGLCSTERVGNDETRNNGPLRRKHKRTPEIFHSPASSPCTSHTRELSYRTRNECCSAMGPDRKAGGGGTSITHVIFSRRI